MRRSLAQTLAQVHAEFGIYYSEVFSVPDSQNIIYRISAIQELAYLHQFYVDYQREYITKLQKRSDQRSVPKLTNVSRSVDLPFIGEAVIQTGRAKHLFVFEGSLSPADRLSVTVLSCLWPLARLQSHQDIFKTFWPRRRHAYDYIVDCFGINVEIAKHSYVVDAVRIGNQAGKQDLQQNRQLLKREIEQLNPELVVLVGGIAKRTIASKTQRERRCLYFNVPFPMKWRSKQNSSNANRKYQELRNRWVA